MGSQGIAYVRREAMFGFLTFAVEMFYSIAAGNQ